MNDIENFCIILKKNYIKKSIGNVIKTEPLREMCINTLKKFVSKSEFSKALNNVEIYTFEYSGEILIRDFIYS